MATKSNYEQWAQDAQILQGLGSHFLPQCPDFQVRLPRNLADEALAAWQRDDEGDELANESPEQQRIRDQAATLGLIGLAIESTGIADGDDVVFRLGAWIVGNALTAADEAGQLG